ncbi:MAG: glycosyltransferase [Sneathiella sp.]|nr:glycosyltransferase [Sneathiella sp.]
MSLDVTIVLSIRETYSMTMNSLNLILEHSPEDVKIVFIASKVPAYIMEQVEEKADERDIQIVRFDHFLTPNQARNASIDYIKTKYVAFVDNDAIVSKGWLEALMNCAEEEGAAVVGPLTFERFPLWKYVHVAGGLSEIEVTEDGDRICHQRINCAHLDITKNPREFVRTETKLVEFHAVLIEMDFLKEIGGLDGEIFCMYEEFDLCMLAQEHGRKVFLEPASRVAYLPPMKPTKEDLNYFDLRWSKVWLDHSVHRLAQKYDLTLNTGNLSAGPKFVRGHRMHQYGKTRKLLSKIVGNKGASVFMNRIVSHWDQWTKFSRTHPDYPAWKNYTDTLNRDVTSRR